MRTPRPRPRPARRLRLPRRTARLRLTVLYGAAFLGCSAVVLGVYALLLFGHTTTKLPPGGRSASAQMAGRIPVADVRQADGYDIIRIPVKIPFADVRRAGNFDVFDASLPVPAARQLDRQPPLTRAQYAGLLADVRTHIEWASLQILTVCAIVLAVIAVAAAAIGWIIAGRVLRPLRTITATARRIAASSLHERLALPGPDDELKELGDTLDSLFARLEASFEAQRRFAASASHQLRTPLTRERTLLQVTLADPASTAGTWRAVSRELLASNAEQERLIEALLTLASSEGEPGEREPLDLAAIAGEALAAAGPGIGRLGLDVEADIRPAVIDGDPLLVQQLVTNLVDNAVRHNVPGGELRVATATGRAGGVLSVANSGPEIPAAEVDRLFQPFQRLGPRPARHDGGHGLGLSIVRAIATAHAATIAAQPRPGGGLTIEVTFAPSAAAQAFGPQAGRAARV
jgi:signal transduction histidine kinase